MVDPVVPLMRQGVSGFQQVDQNADAVPKDCRMRIGPTDFAGTCDKHLRRGDRKSRRKNGQNRTIVVFKAL